MFHINQLRTPSFHIGLVKAESEAVPPDSKETEPGSSDQEASPSAGKNTGVVLVPCLHMEVRPYSYFQWYGYF